MNYCMYADNLVMLAEDRLITDTVAKFKWDPKAVPFAGSPKGENAGCSRVNGARGSGAT